MAPHSCREPGCNCEPEPDFTQIWIALAQFSNPALNLAENETVCSKCIAAKHIARDFLSLEALSVGEFERIIMPGKKIPSVVVIATSGRALSTGVGRAAGPLA
jgi:hypothetical protein